MRENVLEFLKKLLNILLIVFLFLLVGQDLGFKFGMDISIFSRIFLFLLLVLVILEIEKRWSEIWPIVKSVSFKAKTLIGSSLRQYPTIWKKIIHLPSLVFRFLWQVFKKCVLTKTAILIFCIFGILLDVFVFDFTSDLVILLLTTLWILSVWLYKFEGRISIVGGLIFFAFCPFLLIFNKEPIAEKVAIWTYMFLVIGVGQMFIEYLKEEKSAKT